MSMVERGLLETSCIYRLMTLSWVREYIPEESAIMIRAEKTTILYKELNKFFEPIFDLAAALHVLRLSDTEFTILAAATVFDIGKSSHLLVIKIDQSKLVTVTVL